MRLRDNSSLEHLNIHFRSSSCQLKAASVYCQILNIITQFKASFLDARLSPTKIVACWKVLDLVMIVIVREMRRKLMNIVMKLTWNPEQSIAVWLW